MDALIGGDRDSAHKLVGFSIPDEFPDDDGMHGLTFRRDQVKRDATWAAWSLRAIVMREANAMIGTVTFHGPPGVNETMTKHAAEVGYTVFPEHRGAGIATEAARAMIDWAHNEHSVTHFISGIAPDNVPSLRVNEKLGFVATGEFIDGELIFQLRL